MKKNQRLVKNNGFSMIELLVVTTIIIILTTIGMVSYSSANRNARNGKRKADLETVRQALVLYRTDEGTYPVGSSFSGMVSTLGSNGYLTTTSMNDPQNTGIYVYTYSSATGTDFTLNANLEPDGTAYQLTNP